MRAEYIIIIDYCNHYNIETSFVDILDDIGIIELKEENDQKILKLDQLKELDRCRELYYNLHINPEGIDVILNLLQKQQKLQEEIEWLKSKVRMHE